MNDLSSIQRFEKRVFDLLVSSIGLFFLWPIIVVTALIASIETRGNGFFTQPRVGENAKLFSVIKLRTMKDCDLVSTTVTTTQDPRITKSGKVFRKLKLDELPQLINVMKGEMSFVGPRPDVPGYADQLFGDDKLILTVRPGITGPATLKYRNEEKLLTSQLDPEKYNREVIYPDKVRINKEYVQNWSFWKDIKYILRTVR